MSAEKRPHKRALIPARLRAIFPALLAAGLFALGLYALYRLLAPVDLGDVIAQVKGTPWTRLALALLATLGGYLSLVGYDWSALRYIGKPLPLPVTMTGGLMAYAFGNTIGLSAVSGGAVRYRIYSGLGLDAYDVAAVSTFAAMSFGIAATVVGLSALVLYPDALGGLAPFRPMTMQMLAIIALGVMILPLAWVAVRGSSMKIGRFELRAPSLKVLGGQVLFSVGDIGCSAMALYLLLPSSDLSFLNFVGIFAAATMAGILSHVPGGVGVFETVVIAAMPAGTSVEKVAAALLMYRMTYYLIPFIIALVVLALYEALVVVRGVAAKPPTNAWLRALSSVSPALRAVSPLAPLVLSAMIFGSGLWMSLAALIPPSSDAGEALDTFFPLAFVEGGALLSSALGAGMIVLALGVARRSLGAYLLSISAMAAGAVVSLLQGLDYERAVTLAFAIIILLPFRREFHRRSGLVHGAFSPSWFLLVGGLILSVAFLIVLGHKGTTYSNEMWWQFAANSRAPRALRAGLVAALGLALSAFALLLRSPRVHPQPPRPDELALATGIVASVDEPAAAFALTGDKSLMFSDDRRAFVAYGVHGRSWIALGAPVGPEDSAAEAAWAFADAARRAGARPIFYEVAAVSLPLMLDLGLNLHKLGEEAVVDLTEFALDGPRRKKLRVAHARAQRDGMLLQIIYPPHHAVVLAQLRAISDDWLRARNLHEKRFSVGRFDEDWLNRWPIAIVVLQGRIVAFANILTTTGRGMATVDLMRHLHDAPAGVMEFLFTEVMLQLKAEGVGRFSMGMAPLAGLQTRSGARLWNRFGSAVYRHGGHFYNFAGLRSFKAKFEPDWVARYIAAPSAAPPLVPLADAAILIAGGMHSVVSHPADRGHGPADAEEV